MKQLNSIFSFLQKNSEFLIVILVLFVISMMVIPLPHEFVDGLITVNIMLSVVVLMVIIYMTSPLHLTSFPTMLLILTMLRIGITVSTTRLILLEADAGQIVHTFGTFVAGGNLIVGIIVFSIITVVNFLVITKGSERVAEVAARFSLDAMPGKQMSIDSDLRANTIDMKEATNRRKNLELESKLYGAMDGAMKFVKGDSIASIIAIIINLIGGISVGLFMHDMSMSDSLRTYSILTIGDGLVQQLPALLVSISAGMMITRVSDQSDTDRPNIGQIILRQLGGYPKALFAASGLLFLMAFIPGMPTAILIGFAIMLIIIGVILQRVAKKAESAGGPGEKSAQPKLIDSKGGEADNMPQLETWKLYPLLLYISSSLRGTEYVKKINESLVSVQKNILTDLGVEVPQIYLSYDEALAEDSYKIFVHEIPASTGKIIKNNVLLLEKENNLPLLGIDHYTTNETSFGEKINGIWIPENKLDTCKEFGLSTFTVGEFLNRHISYVIKKHVSTFIGMQEIKALLDKMTDYQDLIRELLRMLPLNKITDVLQRLIAEDISIRNFKAILDALLEWSQREKDTILITEYVRVALGRYIAYKFTNGKNVLPCILLSHDIEDAIRDSIRHTATGSYLALDPTISASIVESCREKLEQYKSMLVKPVILTQLDIRRYTRSIVEKELPFLHVLSFQETENHTEFDSLGVIEI
jgi:type III secretion protein V